MYSHPFRVAAAALLALLAVTAVADKPDDGPELLRLEFAFIRKRPDLTHDQFYDYWLNTHGPKAVTWVLKHKKCVPNYVQVQTRPELRDQLAPAPAFPYDGIVEFDITDYACFKAALDDGYWGSVIVPDTANFIDFSPTGVVSTNATTTLGARKVLVWDGKAVKKDKNH